MNKFLTVAGLVLVSNTCYMTEIYAAESAPLATIIDALGQRDSIDYHEGDWEARIGKIKGVKWKWSIYEMGAHDIPMHGTTRIGRDPNPNVGKTEVLVEGPNAGPSKVSITIDNKDDQVEILDLFGPGKLKRIVTTCDVDEASSVQLTYNYTKKGYKPLYVYYEKSWGKTGSIDVVVSNYIEDILPKDCKVSIK